MTIRIAASGELSEILALARDTPWKNSDFIEREVCLGHVTVAAGHIGIRGFIISNKEFFERPFIWLVLVHESYRRQGIGGGLFGSVEARYRGSLVYTSTNSSNDIMAAFLKARGYCVIGQIDLDPGDPEIFYRLNVASR
jgi:GNAT superfamily N-acetyltransferase